MSSDYDVEMNLDETLELDTIVKKSDIASDPITKLKNIDTDTDYTNDLNDIETHTSIFNPTESGEYEIEINGQILSIYVKSLNSIPPNSEADNKLAHRWYLGSIDPFVDQIGNATATNNGTTVIKDSDFYGGSARKGDGVDDYVDLTNLGSYYNNIQSGSWAVAFNIVTTDSDVDILGWDDNRTTGNYTLFKIMLTNEGKPRLYLRNSNGGRIEIESNTVINDGKVHRICVTGRGTTDQDIFWFVDSNKTSTTVTQSDTVNNMEKFKSSVHIFSANEYGGGVDNGYIESIINDLCMFSSSLTDIEGTSYN